MKPNDINELFKELQNGESTNTDSMDRIWEKVEAKLDEKKERRIIPYWKISGIAASLLIIIGLTFGLNQFFKESNPSEEPQENQIVNVLENDTEKKSEQDDKVEDEIMLSNEEIVYQSVAEKGHERIENQYNIRDNSVETLNNSAIQYAIDPKIVNDTIPVFKSNQHVIAKLDAAEIKAKKKITGIIIDENGFPIEDVEIYDELNPKQLVYTDEEGKFSIQSEIGNRLVFNDIINGTVKRIPIASSKLGTIKLANEHLIEAVVITGGIKLDPAQNVGSYTIVSKDNFESNHRKSYKKEIKQNESRNAGVSGENFEMTPVSSIDEVLNGRVAGLVYEKNQPTNNIIIRGVGTLSGNPNPLYVIDGVIQEKNTLADLDPENVKSVIVLKDASATALYGSRGANGVIVIQTKDGKYKKKGFFKRLFGKKEKVDNTYIQPELPQNISHSYKIQVSNEEYSSYVENEFENPAGSPLSTFSIDVDRAAYSNIRRFLNNGQTVPKDAVRIEEMINYFTYSYPQPAGKHPFSISTEYSDSPWNPGHKILRIGLQGKDLPKNELPNSNLVFLIDVSGSMSDYNKLPLLKKSFELLVNNLREKDKVSIVVYAGAAGVVLEPTSGKEKMKIINALNNLNAGGSTAGGQGIELAYKLAQENFIKGGNNRVILATDGDFNVGVSSAADLQTLIEEKRKSGVFLTCLGYGMGNYKDNRLETLSDKGNGNYAYIDNLQEANKFLVKEFSGTLFTIAKDVKIQIEFNPGLVQSYRLIGYENRLLRDEDFVNDSIDAGEIGAGHQVTALYEIIPVGVKSEFSAKKTDLKYSNNNPVNSSFSNELATIKFRYKKPDEDHSTEIVQTVKNQSVPLLKASADFKLAADVAWFGLKLRDSEYVKDKSTESILKLGKEIKGKDPEGYRMEFLKLVELVE